MDDIAFLYSAGETPWPGMGRFLLDRGGIVADIIAQSEAIIARQLGLSLRAALASDAPFPNGVLMPINAVMQIALTQEWRERGIHPSVLIARCSGEFAAAHTSGAIDLEDALEVPCRVARLIAGGKGRGRLIVVGVPCGRARVLIRECPVRCEFASEADETAAVIGCAVEDAAKVKAYFDKLNIWSVVTSRIIATHTWLMEDTKDELLRPLRNPTRPSRLPIYSATTRGVLPCLHDWSHHFWRVLRHDLSISTAIGAALDHGARRIVEIGSHPILRGFVEREAAARRLGLSSFATMERNRPMRATMDETLATLEPSRAAA